MSNSRKVQALKDKSRAERNAKLAESASQYTPAPGYEVHARSVYVDAKTGEPLRSWEKERKRSVLEIPPGFVAVPVSAYVGPDGTVRSQHVRIVPAPVALDEVDASVPRVEPLPAPVRRTSDEELTLYAIGDPHIGMLSWAPETGEHFDLKIAVRELRECARQMVAAVPDSSTGIVANLGDYYHAKDNSWLTQSGHRLDGDGRWEKVAQAGERLMRDIIDLALTKHERVIVINLRGNHDDQAVGRLVSHLRGAYENEPRVEIRPQTNMYQYHMFGSCLFGFTHGDRVRGNKALALESIMATDAPDMWGQTRYRYWHTGHVHHLTTAEVRGCVVETHRTLAAKDEWHASSGYRSGQSLQAITYSRRFGEVSRVTVPVERVRESLAAG